MNLTKTLQKHIIPSKRKWICTCEIGRASRFYYVTIVQKSGDVLVMVVFAEVVCGKWVLKKIRYIHRKLSVLRLFLMKLQAFRPATLPLSKRDSNTGILLWTLQNLQDYLFWSTPANGRVFQYFKTTFTIIFTLISLASRRIELSFFSLLLSIKTLRDVRLALQKN